MQPHDDSPAPHARFASFPQPRTPALYPDHGGLRRVLKALVEDAPDSDKWTLPRSGFDRLMGRYRPLFDVCGVEDLLELNTHHSVCLERCAHVVVGQGHETKKIYDVLDPLTVDGWQSVLAEVGFDIAEKHVGFLEVVREERGVQASPIAAIYPIPVRFIEVEVEDAAGHMSYLVRGENGMERRFARFGDLERCTEKWKIEPGAEDGLTEIISLRVPNSRTSWFGHPTWLSAVPWIELGALAVQRKYDFYFNRGVPELLLFIKSVAGIDDETWAKVEAVFKSFTGIGNQYKSAAFQITDSEAQVTPVKLASDLVGDSTEFSTTYEMIDAHVVSAHGMPPLLASIQTAGRLGGTANEGSNAVRIYQILRGDPLQMLISRVLARTLGNPKLNGGLSLTAEDFLPGGSEENEASMRKAQAEVQRAAVAGETPNPQEMRDYHTGFNTVIDRLNFGFSPEISGKMREDEGDARARGRDPKQGLIRE